MMQNETIIHLIGYASGIAGADYRVGDGPLVIQQSPFLIEWGQPHLKWDAIIKTTHDDLTHIPEIVRLACEKLATMVSDLVKNNQIFTIIGGDHTSAIGTWSGVYDAIYQKGELGLIWIDAHMDSHTPQTTQSGRLHGMPLACLLGQGEPSLTSLLHASPKLQPNNVCLIGVRSYEQGEVENLQRLNVKVYFMDEVKERGFAEVYQEAVKKVSANTIAYGFSLDLDAIDPSEAPGVDVPEADGIHVEDLLAGLSQTVDDPKLIATEIVEFDPFRDKNHITEKLIVNLLKLLHQKRM